MSNTEYDGEPIDASWSTAPWNRDGETIEASDDNTEEHDMDTIEWPEGATPKEELKDDQIAVIKKAARYPNIDNCKKLTRMAVGEKHSNSYAGSVIKVHWPQRYWLAPDESSDEDYLSALNRSDSNDENIEDKSERGANNPQSKLTKIAVKDIRNRLKNGAELGDLADKYSVVKACVRKAARGETWGHIKSPAPVIYDKYNNEYISKQEISDSETIEKESGELSTQKMRELALSGKSSADIAFDSELRPRQVRKHLRGETCNGDPDIPPLAWNESSSQSWEVKDQEHTEDTEQTTINEQEEQQEQDTSERERPPVTQPDPSQSNARKYVAVAAVLYAVYRVVRRLT